MFKNLKQPQIIDVVVVRFGHKGAVLTLSALGDYYSVFFWWGSQNEFMPKSNRLFMPALNGIVVYALCNKWILNKRTIAFEMTPPLNHEAEKIYTHLDIAEFSTRCSDSVTAFVSDQFTLLENWLCGFLIKISAPDKAHIHAFAKRKYT